MAAVGEATKPHRERKARSFDERAAKLERAARLANLSDRDVKRAGAWFRARAKGQRRRIENVRGCGREKAAVIVCDGCGTLSEKGMRCGVGSICVSCRGKIASKKRGNFARSRDVIISRARALGLLRENRRGGRWSEKLLTLTAPHLPTVGLRERIERVRNAWPFFLRSFNRWLRAQKSHEHSAWFRNVEWTQAEDHLGHPHIHAWLFCPYLDRQILIGWWRDALQRVGYNSTNCAKSKLETSVFQGEKRASHKMQCDDSISGEIESPADELRHLMIDIREARGGDVGVEVIKYLTKDLASDGSKIAATLYASVVSMFDGARTTQSSRGFMGLSQFKPMCDCGSCASFSVRIVDVVKLIEQRMPSSRESRAPP